MRNTAESLWDLVHELAPHVPRCDEVLHRRVQSALDAGVPKCSSSPEELERLKGLNKRALAIITDAIMHGMPITPEVADVRNQIVKL